MTHFSEKLIQSQMFEQYIQSKEEKRKKQIFTDGFDTLIKNLPELKTRLDEAKKFASGLLKKAGQGIEKTKNQLTEQNRSLSSYPSMETTIKKQQFKRRNTTNNSGVRVAKELIFDDDVTNTAEPNTIPTRPARPPPPRPPAPSATTVTTTVTNENNNCPVESLINFDSPPITTPVKTLELTDNFGLINKYNHLSLNQKSNPSSTSSATPGAPIAPPRSNPPPRNSWLHQNIQSDLDEFDPLK
jgi:hypothetical protein